MRYEYHLQSPGFTVENINIQNVSRPQNYKHSFRNGRTAHGFIYTVSGRMCDTFLSGEDRRVFVDAGEVIFIPKGCRYTATYLGENTEIKIVQFELADGSLPSYLREPIKINIPDISERIEAFFKPVENHTAHHPFYCLACLYGLLWQIDENYAGIPKKFKKLQPALSEISEYYRQNEPISHYARLCGMSEVNFRRLFREYTGLTPIDYRNDIRLTNARFKLQSGEYNVSEAAEAAGFSNLSFFIRLYKKKFGYTPKKE